MTPFVEEKEDGRQIPLFYLSPLIKNLIDHPYPHRHTHTHKHGFCTGRYSQDFSQGRYHVVSVLVCQ